MTCLPRRLLQKTGLSASCLGCPRPAQGWGAGPLPPPGCRARSAPRPGVELVAGPTTAPAPRVPGPGLHSPLIFEEMLRGLAVPHHPGPVLLQRLDVPGEAGGATCGTPPVGLVPQPPRGLAHSRDTRTRRLQASRVRPPGGGKTRGCDRATVPTSKAPSVHPRREEGPGSRTVGQGPEHWGSCGVGTSQLGEGQTPAGSGSERTHSAQLVSPGRRPE